MLETLSFYNKGQRCPPVESLKIVKRGIPALSNNDADALFSGVYVRRNRLPQDIYDFFRSHSSLIRTSTFFGKMDYDRELDSAIVSTDRAGWTLTTVVPVICRGRTNVGFGINLMRDNFDLTIYRGNKATIVLDEKSIRVVELVRKTNSGGPWDPQGYADDSTLFIPDAKLGNKDGSEERTMANEERKRSLFTIEAAWAGLVVRNFTELTWPIVYASDLSNKTSFRIQMLLKAA